MAMAPLAKLTTPDAAVGQDDAEGDGGDERARCRCQPTARQGLARCRRSARTAITDAATDEGDAMATPRAVAGPVGPRRRSATVAIVSRPGLDGSIALPLRRVGDRRPLPSAYCCDAHLAAAQRREDRAPAALHRAGHHHHRPGEGLRRPGVDGVRRDVVGADLVDELGDRQQLANIGPAKPVYSTSMRSAPYWRSWRGRSPCRTPRRAGSSCSRSRRSTSRRARRRSRRRRCEVLRSSASRSRGRW